MNFKVILEPSPEGGFTVYVPSLPGCISEGETKEFPALVEFTEYLKLAAAINNHKLFVEIDTACDKIREELFADDTQRELAQHSKHVKILGKFFDIKMTNEDMEYLHANKDKFDTTEIVDFIDMQAMLNDVEAVPVSSEEI